MSITAKSVILDIADNWGGWAIGVRQVDFYNNGTKITNLPASYSAYATSQGSYIAEYAFDTSTSKTGDATGTTWLAGGEATNQRLICVFDANTTFDEIRINNYHSSGGYTDRGAKNVVINVSADAITNTTYNATITNSTQIFDGQFDQHTASNIEDEQTLTLDLPTPSEYNAKTVILDMANNWGDDTYLAIRQVDFWYNGSKITNTLTGGDFVAYETTKLSDTYHAENAFDTSYSKTGTHEHTGWQSDYNYNTNQRIICVFASPITFDQIRINNHHYQGTATTRDVKDVVITITTDEVTSTVYNSSISNGLVVYDGTFREHVSVDAEDEQLLKLIVPPTYSVIYDDNTSTSGTVPVDPNEYDLSDTATVSGNTGNLTKDLYTYGGWNTESNGSGTDYEEGDTFTIGPDDVTLYALWIPGPYAPTWAPALWNPSDKNSSVELTNGNKTMSNGTSSFSWMSARADLFFSTGKLYFEVKIGPDATHNYAYIGVGRSLASLSAIVGNDQYGWGFYVRNTYTKTRHNGVDTPVEMTAAPGDIIGVAVDIGNGKIWWSVNNSWISGNPSEGTGANYSNLSFSNLAPMASVYGPNYGRITINSTPDDCSYGAPTDFNYWATESYTVTYDGNGNDSGTVPVDSNYYEVDDTVTVSGNTGSVAKTGYSYAGWNTETDGSGTDYEAGDTFTMIAMNAVLYAKWGAPPTYVTSPEVIVNVDFTSSVIGDSYKGISSPEVVVNATFSSDIKYTPYYRLVSPEVVVNTSFSSTLNLKLMAPEVIVTTDFHSLVVRKQGIMSPEIIVTTDFTCSTTTYSLKDTAHYYYFTLTGGPDGLDDIDMPIENFQCRRRSGDPTFLTVTIPTYDYADDIAARPNGKLRVDIVFKRYGEIIQRRKLVQTNFDGLMSHQGTKSSSIILQGYVTESYVSKTLDIDTSMYRSVNLGIIRHRLAKPIPSLNPGDIVNIGTDTFVANVISFYIAPHTQTMEVAEE